MNFCRRSVVLGFSSGIFLLFSPCGLRATGFQINFSESNTNLHLGIATASPARLIWMKGDRPDSVTNIAQIEAGLLVQHDFQTPTLSASQFFRAVLVDTNIERAPFAANGSHGLAIVTNGSIVCWGDNSLGQFGNNLRKELGGNPYEQAACWAFYNYINDSTGPLPQSADTDWVSVAAGTAYCLALKSNGSIWGWGDNSGGGLGNLVQGIYAFAVAVDTNASWQSVFAYGNSSFAIRTDGTLWAWGDNTDSVLGLGSGFANTNKVIFPTRVGTASNWVKVVSLPHTLSIGIQSDGSLWAWGLTTLPSYVRAGYAQTNLTTPVTTSPSPINISGPWVGASFSTLGAGRAILLRADGTLWTVTPHDSDYSNWQVYETYFQNQFTNTSSIYSILTNSGATPDQALSYVTSEFYQMYPQLLGFNFDYPSFLQVTSDAQYFQSYSSQANWVMLASGIALRQDGTAWTIGEGSTRSGASPRDGDWQRVNSDTDWRYVTGSFLAAKADGRLWGWQGGSFPDLSQPTNTTDMIPVPGTNKWISAKLTTSHIVAMDAQSNLWVWGSNEFGQLGLGDNEPRLAPTELPAGPWADYAVGNVGIGSANCFTLAVNAEGQLWAWGNYDFSGTNVTSPFRLHPERNWRSVSCLNSPLNGGKAFALAQDGTLWAWGNNNSQCLGINNSNFTVNVPTQVAGSNWLAVAPEISSTIALKTDGTLWGWGGSSVNIGLGYATNLVYPTPVLVSTNAWTVLAADASDGFGIRSDGTLWSWGQEDTAAELSQPLNEGLQFTQCWNCTTGPCDPFANPEVYPGGTNITLTPSQIGTENSWTSVKYSETGNYTLGLQQDGSLWVWGRSPFPSVTNELVYLTPPSHPFPGVPYPELRSVVPVPHRVGTNQWSFVDTSGAAVTSAGDLYLWNNRAQNGQTFIIPPWLPVPIRSNIVCRLPPQIP